MNGGMRIFEVVEKCHWLHREPGLGNEIARQSGADVTSTDNRNPPRGLARLSRSTNGSLPEGSKREAHGANSRDRKDEIGHDDAARSGERPCAPDKPYDQQGS